MHSIQKDAEGGINNLIKEQAAVPGEITVSLYQFDTVYERVFGPINASDAPLYGLHPRGMTALLDATARAITETGEYLTSKPESERPSKVVFAIVTDGAENSSREVNKAQVKEMVTKQTNEYNWEFVYIGANLDAMAEANSMGIASSVQYHSTGASVQGLYAGVSRSLTDSRVHNVNLASTVASEYTEDGEEIRK